MFQYTLVWKWRVTHCEGFHGFHQSGNPRSFVFVKNQFKKTLIKKGATIGANSTVICGNEIGKYALIGAGAVVTKDVPNHAIAVGNPARITGWICQCGLKLKFSDDRAICQCGQEYEKTDNEELGESNEYSIT